MNEVTIGIVGIGILLLLFGTGIELGFAMGLIGFVGFAYLRTFNAALNVVGRDFFTILGSYAFMVLPLFVLMGQIAFNAGIAERLFNSAHKFLGHIAGGLAMATVAGAVAFKAISGSTAATTATFAGVAIPEMDRYNYDKRLSSGVVASVGTLGSILPPSGVLIIFGIITEQSIGRLFLAGVIPGLIIGLFFIGIIFGWVKINPSIAPKSPPSPWSDRLPSLIPVAWVLIIFVIVVGGISGGFFTPSEAGAVGAFAVVLLTLCQRDLTFWKYVASAKQSLHIACMIMMLIVGSTILGHFLTATNIPQITGDWVVGLPLHRNLIMLIICLVYLIGGSFIDDLAFMMLATPIFYPAVLKLGFDPIWFGILICVVVMIGVIIPPVAISIFIVKNVTKLPMGTIYRGATPFLISFVIVGILLFVFPEIALWLPSVFFK
jgi:C4-dicarboxylate transporter, DctM subunit